MKPRFHQRLQVQGHDRLRDPVRDRRHAQRTPAVRLGDLHRPTGGGNQVPEESRFQILYRFPSRSSSNSAILAVHAGSTLVRLDPPLRLPNQPLGDLKRLGFGSLTRLLPPQDG